MRWSRFAVHLILLFLTALAAILILEEFRQNEFARLVNQTVDVQKAEFRELALSFEGKILFRRALKDLEISLTKIPQVEGRSASAAIELQKAQKLKEFSSKVNSGRYSEPESRRLHIWGWQKDRFV